MPANTYTHNFNFALGDGSFLEGECLFKSNGKVTFKIKNFSEPLPIETLQHLKVVTDYLELIYKESGEISKIVFKKKE